MAQRDTPWGQGMWGWRCYQASGSLGIWKSACPGQLDQDLEGGVGATPFGYPGKVMGRPSAGSSGIPHRLKHPAREGQ